MYNNEMTYKDAIRKALYDEMLYDPRVLLFGEDDRHNLYGYTEGLFETFGPKRVIDIPLSEAGILGTAIGASICGLRPIVDFTNENFLLVAMDQIVNMLSKTEFMSNGALRLPLTLFSSAMYGGGNAAQHSDRLHSLFMGVPGLTVICPSSVEDIYHMLREAIRMDSPVICFADRALFWSKGRIGEGSGERIGKARLLRQGEDVTVVSIAGSIKYVIEAVNSDALKNISIEVIDVRSVSPLDYKTIEDSVKKTGRIVICDTSNKTCSSASEIAALLAQQSLSYLKRPIRIAANSDSHIPFARNMEKKVMLSTEKVINAVIDIL